MANDILHARLECMELVCPRSIGFIQAKIPATRNPELAHCLVAQSFKLRCFLIQDSVRRYLQQDIDDWLRLRLRYCSAADMVYPNCGITHGFRNPRGLSLELG